jgi:hypothetical protein
MGWLVFIKIQCRYLNSIGPKSWPQMKPKEKQVIKPSQSTKEESPKDRCLLVTEGETSIQLNTNTTQQNSEKSQNRPVKEMRKSIPSIQGSPKSVSYHSKPCHKIEIIMDFHGNGLEPRKMYKNQDLNIHVWQGPYWPFSSVKLELWTRTFWFFSGRDTNGGLSHEHKTSAVPTSVCLSLCLSVNEQRENRSAVQCLHEPSLLNHSCKLFFNMVPAIHYFSKYKWYLSNTRKSTRLYLSTFTDKDQCMVGCCLLSWFLELSGT